jgi:hypothetical protein
MGWRDLLEDTVGEFSVFPWLGGRKIYRSGRTWTVEGRLPREFGWFTFELTGSRSATLDAPADQDMSYGSEKAGIDGYVVGNRFIPMNARVDPDPEKLISQTVPAFLVDPGLPRFSVVAVFADDANRFIYRQQLFPTGPEDEVRRAFIDREESIQGIKGVSPALDLAFVFETRQRNLLEQRREEIRLKREEERRREEARRSVGTGLGRRTLAATDFDSAAKAALALSGAELLDTRAGYTRNEMVVQYRFEGYRLECVADKSTLRIIDSGVCLTNERTGEKGDTRFTLETLPAVIRQAIREDKLVIYRHVD